jgi:hypothetical protein
MRTGISIALACAAACGTVAETADDAGGGNDGATSDTRLVDAPPGARAVPAINAVEQEWICSAPSGVLIAGPPGIHINTSNGEIRDSSGTLLRQQGTGIEAASGIRFEVADQGDGRVLGVMVVDSFTVQSGAVVTAGPAGLGLVVCGEADIAGVIDASGHGRTAGPGGHAGGTETTSPPGNGQGPGGGRAGTRPPTGSSGGGGGGGAGHGGGGGLGGTNLFAGGMPGGAYGDGTLIPLEGGSGGGATGAGGGAGGGAVYILAEEAISLGGDGQPAGINVGGAGGIGSPNYQGAGGGGSGGAILLEARRFVFLAGAVLAANGGGGGGIADVTGGPSNGEDGHLSAGWASGGLDNSGFPCGGQGGSAGSPFGAMGQGSCGGAGGAGRVRLHSESGSVPLGPLVVSPDASDGLFSQGMLRLE